MMKWVDPEIELVACGSCTNVPGMKTYPEWDRIVLDNCYEHVDYIALHRYYSYDRNISMVWENPFSVEDIAYLSKDLTSYIDTVLAAADFIKGKSVRIRKYTYPLMSGGSDEQQCSSRRLQLD